jgi:hypothetical protein
VNAKGLFRPLVIGLAAGAAGIGALAGVTLGGGGSPTPADGASTSTPPFKASWGYQLQGELRVPGAHVFDIDGFDTPNSFVSRLHARGRYAVCYIDAGTWENWRPDRNRFPASVLGRSNGWPGERWLDIRRLDVLAPIMRARMQICKRKGFDAIEPDNVDGYANQTGFALTARDQLTYNRYLARTAHNLGVAVGLKNDLDQVASLQGAFDFAVVEQCFQFSECWKLQPFLRSAKPVFEVEYNLPRSSFCARADRLGINALRAQPSLASPGTPCD